MHLSWMMIRKQGALKSNAETCMLFAPPIKIPSYGPAYVTKLFMRCQTQQYCNGHNHTYKNAE